jgi:hypothetical protein
VHVTRRAGERVFFPNAFQLTLNVPESSKVFGHTDSHVASIMQSGGMKSTSSLAVPHAAVLFAYTEACLHI